MGYKLNFCTYTAGCDIGSVPLANNGQWYRTVCDIGSVPLANNGHAATVSHRKGGRVLLIFLLHDIHPFVSY
jgi:hypothetical protein